MRKNLATVLGVVALGSLLLVSCGGAREYVVVGTERAPDADANIKIESQEGGNFLVTVGVEFLLPPSRLDPGNTTYTVWFQAPGGVPQRMGNLTYDEDARTGEMVATTTFPKFDIIISGEAGETATAPSDFLVFRTTVEAPQ